MSGPRYIVVRGVGVAEVEGVQIREIEGALSQWLRVRPLAGGAGTRSQELREASADWRPLMSVAEANRYSTLLQSQITLSPMWRGAHASRQFTLLLAKSLDPDAFVDAYLRTRPADPRRPRSGTQILRDTVRDRLQTEIDIVLRDVSPLPRKNPAALPRRVPEETPELLRALQELSAYAARVSVQNKKGAYRTNLTQRALLLDRLA